MTSSSTFRDFSEQKWFVSLSQHSLASAFCSIRGVLRDFRERLETFKTGTVLQFPSRCWAHPDISEGKNSRQTRQQYKGGNLVLLWRPVWTLPSCFILYFTLFIDSSLTPATAPTTPHHHHSPSIHTPAHTHPPSPVLHVELLTIQASPLPPVFDSLPVCVSETPSDLEGFAALFLFFWLFACLFVLGMLACGFLVTFASLTSFPSMTSACIKTETVGPHRTLRWTQTNLVKHHKPSALTQTQHLSHNGGNLAS